MVNTIDSLVCPRCKQPVTWTTIKLANGSEISTPDYECKNCGEIVIKFYRNKDWKKRTFIEQGEQNDD